MKRQILAVDDEPHMLQLLERIVVERTPFGMTTTSNSLDVPGLLDAREYDLIITDLRMPGIDGLEILRMVKARDRVEDVVIVTAFGTLESAMEAIGQGALDYIVKPFKKDQLLLSIDRAMRCVALKKQVRQLEALFQLEPWERACGALQRHYVRAQALCLGEDPGAIAERTGLPQEVVDALLADE